MTVIRVLNEDIRRTEFIRDPERKLYVQVKLREIAIQVKQDLVMGRFIDQPERYGLPLGIAC
jgi:hypothetical protein